MAACEWPPARRQTRSAQGDNHAAERPRLRYMDYKVGWICALEKELAAAQAMLDEIHEPLPTASNDSNTYTLGSIGPHNVVLACLPAGHGQYGLNNAAIVGANMLHTFQFVDKRLLVGIGDGIPDSVDIRLGDVVVGDQVFQYDLGKSLPGQKFHRTSVPARPPQVLLTAVSNLQAQHRRIPCQIPSLVDEMVRRHSPLMCEYARPDAPDILYRHTYGHACSPENANLDCSKCDPTQSISRSPRQNASPVIHLGKVASGNQVIKDGTMRRSIATELDAICFEMEAAGLMSDTSCLVIRGICDYSDSHKNKAWQEYAAATAAAYARELLLITPTTTMIAGDAHQQLGSISEPSDARRIQLLASLRFEEIRFRHDDIKPPLQETCKWFLSEEVFLDWRDATKYQDHHGFLWISGKPGAGKSTIMKFIYTHARKTWVLGPDAAVVAFFFNARGVELEKSTVGLYRSLLFQIMTAFPDLNYLLELQSEGQGEIVNWALPVLQNVFQDVIENLGQRQLTCFIDALDECDENQIWNMIDLLQDLGNVASETSKQFYVCLSSRHYPHVEIQPCLRPTLEHQRGHAKDIERYVHSKLRQKNGRAVSEVTSLILSKAAGVFMWVVLVVHILRREFQRGNALVIKQRLLALPSELSTLFKEMLCRDDDDLDGLLLCIQWILFAQQPLTCREFYYALHSGLYQEESATLQEWDPELVSEMDMAHFVSSTSKGLAEVTSSQKPTVQFIHESVRDFLIKDGGMLKVWPQYVQGQDFEAMSHDRLKACCALYLKVDVMACVSRWGSSEEQRAIAARLAGSRRLLVVDAVIRLEARFPFLRYAALCLWPHANLSATVISQVDFFREFDVGSWISAHNLFVNDLDNIYTRGASRAYIFAANNWVDLLRFELDSGSDIWSPRELFGHPLIVASAHGHEASVKVLLATEGMETQPQDSSGRTPLGCAVSNNHETIVDVLLAVMSPNTAMAFHRGRSPLKLAQLLNRLPILKRLLCAPCVAFRDYADTIMEIINMGFDVMSLLDAGCSILGVRNQHGETLLQMAIDRGNLQLLQNLVKLPGGDVVEEECRPTTTALIYAASRGNVDMVEHLLSIDGIDVKSQDKTGQTVLSAAMENKQMPTVALIVRTCRLDAESASVVLRFAACNGMADIVKTLLSVDGVDVNLKNGDGRTALTMSVYRNDQDVVSLLVGSGRLSTESVEVALRYAAAHGYLKTVKSLLQVVGIDINSRDDGGRTALSQAVANSHDSIIAVLVNTRQLDAESILAALTYATSQSEVKLVESILSLDNINANDVSRVAVSTAMEKKRTAVLTLLVRNRQVCATSTDSKGQSLFSWAMEHRSDELLTAIVQSGGVDLGTRDSTGLTLLAWAAGNGCSNLLKLLLSLRADLVNVKDSEGRTPLLWAAGNGYAKEAALLIASAGIELDSADLLGRTPLSWAAGNGYIKVVLLLLNNKTVDANARDSAGRNPLSWAAGNGQRDVVRELIGWPGVAVNSQDLTGRTPASWAAGNGHYGSILVLRSCIGIKMDLEDSEGPTP